MDWTAAMELEALGEGRFRGHVDQDWTSLQGVHGGVVAALAVTAAERAHREAGVEPATTLRAATFGYVSGNVEGDLELHVEVVRRGRALVTTHVTTSQDGRTTTLARLHHSTPWEGMEFSDAPPPVPRPEGAVRIRREGPAHLNNVETHLHPETDIFAGNDRAEWVAWSRPLHGGVFDTAWLTMYGDYFPPAVFAKATTPQRAVTIEYSLQIHSTAGSWKLADDEFLAARMHTFHSHEGFAVEDGWIHLPDGTLLATVRQTRLAG
ncbi:acyl-CoA thioesterase [Nocardioides insulae]|uniref:acyl-CoA thioesterase n=1 Tax=Nocardioides insulae TaxID=394734 RepID=UPI00041FBF87|nr:thioesterase family protein [Nocardioides insulae]